VTFLSPFHGGLNRFISEAQLATRLQNSAALLPLRCTHEWSRIESITDAPPLAEAGGAFGHSRVGLAGCGSDCDRPDWLIPVSVDGGSPWENGTSHSAQECQPYCGTGVNDACYRLVSPAPAGRAPHRCCAGSITPIVIKASEVGFPRGSGQAGSPGNPRWSRRRWRRQRGWKVRRSTPFRARA
jgi:hypothetical protein